MFTLSQIKEAHSAMTAGADFPLYAQNLLKLGVTSYTVYVDDGHTVFFGKDGFSLQSPAMYPVQRIASIGDTEKFKYYLRIHQQGQTDYLVFCKHAAQTGFEKWTVNLLNMTCTYYDKPGTDLLIEKIPGL